MGLIGGAVTGAISLINPAAGLAIKAARTVFGFARQHWRAALILSLALLVLIVFLILRGEIRHRDKVIASQAELLGAVKKEVDRGVGKPTESANGPAYIRNFVNNLATVTAALDRQSAALNAAEADANGHDDAAHVAGQVTPAQGQRETVRRKIADPARTTGLTIDEWGRL
jgi:hypothetical protein